MGTLNTDFLGQDMLIQQFNQGTVLPEEVRMYCGRIRDVFAEMKQVERELMSGGMVIDTLTEAEVTRVLPMFRLDIEYVPNTLGWTNLLDYYNRGKYRKCIFRVPQPDSNGIIPYMLDNYVDIINPLKEYMGYEFWDENQEDPQEQDQSCLLYTSPSPRDATLSRMPSSA